MFCKNCGNELKEGSNYCDICGYNINEENEKKPTGKDKYLPSFIMGLIGGLFAFLGGACTAACSGRDSAMILIMGGGIIGLVGACKCLKKLKTGAIIELFAALLIFICFFITGSEIMGVLGFLLLLSGGIVGLILSKTSK